MRWLIFHAFLRPIILWNYAERKAGIVPDEWYWADLLALRWGHTV